MMWRASLLAVVLGGSVAVEPDRNACGAVGLQRLVGQGRVVLAAIALPQGTRVIEPGMPITEDYSVGRLNINLGPDGRIARVWCG